MNEIGSKEYQTNLYDNNFGTEGVIAKSMEPPFIEMIFLQLLELTVAPSGHFLLLQANITAPT